jgi:DNA-binding MarR family transcriptional regulator
MQHYKAAEGGAAIMLPPARASQRRPALTSRRSAHRSVAAGICRTFKSVPTRPRVDFSDYLPYLINRVGWLLVVEFGQNTLARHQLSIAMWRILAVLDDDDGQRQIDLAGRTSIDVSTLSRVVTRLVRMGLVTRARSATNNREVAVRLTPKGAAVVARVVPHAIALERIAIAGLPAKDLAVVRRSLRRMYENLAASVGISARSAAPAERAHAAAAVSARRRRSGARTRR